jgi:hypothetical protein
METAALELQLKDAISAPAKKAADSLSRIAKETERAQAKLDELKANPDAYKKLLSAQRQLNAERNKLKGGFFNWAGPHGIGRIFSASVGQLLADGAEKIGSSLIDAAKSTVETLINGVKFAFDVGSKAEQSHLGYRLSLGEKPGAESLSDVQRFSKLTSFGTSATERMFLPLRRAGFDQQEGRNAYAASLDIAAGQGRGADQGAVEDALESLRKIKLKGGVTDKLLIGMGVSVNDFFDNLSKQLGLSKDEAKKRAEAGKIDPQLLLNTIYSGIEKRQGGILGTGGVAAGKTMEARLQKLRDLPEEYLRKIADTPAWKRLSDKVGSVLEGLSPDSPRGKAIIDKLMGAFGSLTDAAEEWLTPENMDLFAAKIRSSVDTAKELFVIFKDIGGVVLDVVRYIERMIKGYRELKDDLDYVKKGGEAAAGSKTATAAQRAGAKADVLSLMMRPDQDLIDFKKKELRMGDFTADERRQRESEIAQLERQASGPVRQSPAVASTGGKVIHLNVSQGAVVVQPRAGESTEGAARRAGEQFMSTVTSAVEKESLMSGG